MRGSCMISPQDIFIRSLDLLKRNTEIEQREGIKTSYYAVLHRIQEVCRIRGYSISNPNHAQSHECIISAINPDNKYSDAKIVEQRTKRMKKMRKIADYNLQENIDNDQIQTHLRNANTCWACLDRLAKPLKGHLRLVK